MRFMLVLLLALALFLAACRGDSGAETLVTDVAIDLQVEPNPPAVGEGVLRITLTGADGAPIDGAALSVRGDMDHAGMEPVFGETRDSQAGVYQIPIAWSMGGGWIVQVTATLPENRGVARNSFELFVEAVSADSIINTGGAEATEAATPAAGALRIVIPAGTGALIEAGQDPGIIPSEIYLSLSAQSALVIVNNDTVDHTVGPFFVRAGETIRQAFSRPAVYEGGCSIHPGEQVRIVVEA
ncbi:MAG: FixH family protein [Anaerolineae bacterium]|nr:FixH family protein [Anaerolineae bacterium]NUQ05678.1 FixH family protein [Anaerolineae bacterium]